MKSKETKINIEVNIFGTRFGVSVPFSEQDSVRMTEAEMKASLKLLRERYSRKSLPECMAMLAFDYASKYFALKALQEADSTEAEALLRDARRLLGEEAQEDPDTDDWEYGDF